MRRRGFSNKGAKLAATSRHSRIRFRQRPTRNPQGYQHQSGFEKEPLQTPYRAALPVACGRCGPAAQCGSHVLLPADIRHRHTFLIL
ncbi:MAG: hypothetical protein IPJ07_10835 [Acidobacteria bacterium]|nr:hypothetical protein [Acidobacteriota bacterium]